MVDLYPLFVVPLGLAVVYLGRKKITAIALMIFLAFTMGLSVVQSEQFSVGYLHTDRMTKAHYWYIFGKLTIPDYRMDRLEIDRENLNWPYEIRKSGLDFARIEEQIFCDVPATKVGGKESVLIDKRAFFPVLKTDETLFDVQIVYQNNDSLNPGTIYFETFSKYNVYNWKNQVLSTQKKTGSIDTLNFQFNLPIINHKDDKLQVYVVNPSEKEVIVRSFKIRALSLIRK